MCDFDCTIDMLKLIANLNFKAADHRLIIIHVPRLLLTSPTTGASARAGHGGPGSLCIGDYFLLTSSGYHHQLDVASSGGFSKFKRAFEEANNGMDFMLAILGQTPERFAIRFTGTPRLSSLKSLRDAKLIFDLFIRLFLGLTSSPCISPLQAFTHGGEPAPAPGHVGPWHSDITT